MKKIFVEALVKNGATSFQNECGLLSLDLETPILFLNSHSNGWLT